MPDWTAPFKIPKLTTEEYAKQKAAYQAKNDFTITIPGLSDIIKIQTEAPMSALEHTWYKRKQWDKFTTERLMEVRKQKQKRIERYEAMLASPTPAVIQNVGSIMTAVDDAQDAISTLACLGSLAQVVAPRVIKKLIAGPTGLLIAVSDLLNMVQSAGTFCMTRMYGKRGANELQRGSTKGKRYKVKKSTWGRARLPTKGDWIQGLQTTEQVFGLGISLGPLVGLVQDVIFGSVRTTFGPPPKIKFPTPDYDHWYKVAQKASKSQSVLWGFPHMTDDDDILSWCANATLCFQAGINTMPTWNPMEMIEEFPNLEIKAPEPWHSLTLEVIAEHGHDPTKVSGWPQTNTMWANLEELMDITHEHATKNLLDFAQRNKHSFRGYMGVLCANEANAYSLACFESEGEVYYDYDADFKTCQTMMEHGVFLDPDQPLDNFLLFRAYLEDCQEANYNPTIGDVIEFCFSEWNDIKLRQLAGYSQSGFPAYVQLQGD